MSHPNEEKGRWISKKNCQFCIRRKWNFKFNSSFLSFCGWNRSQSTWMFSCNNININSHVGKLISRCFSVSIFIKIFSESRGFHHFIRFACQFCWYLASFSIFFLSSIVIPCNFMHPYFANISREFRTIFLHFIFSLEFRLHFAIPRVSKKSFFINFLLCSFTIRRFSTFIDETLQFESQNRVKRWPKCEIRNIRCVVFQFKWWSKAPNATIFNCVSIAFRSDGSESFTFVFAHVVSVNKRREWWKRRTHTRAIDPNARCTRLMPTTATAELHSNAYKNSLCVQCLNMKCGF